MVIYRTAHETIWCDVTKMDICSHRNSHFSKLNSLWWHAKQKQLAVRLKLLAEIYDKQKHIYQIERLKQWKFGYFLYVSQCTLTLRTLIWIMILKYIFTTISNILSVLVYISGKVCKIHVISLWRLSIAHVNLSCQ